MFKDDILASLIGYSLVLISITGNWLKQPVLLFIQKHNIVVVDAYVSLILHGLQIISVVLGLVLIYKQLKKK